VKTGTPGFVGARLGELRETLGLSKLALSDLIDVSRQSLGAWEKGESSPTPDMFRRLCDQLSMPPQYFLREVPAPEASPTFFRVASTATKGARVRAKRMTRWLHELTAHLSEYVELPEVDLPVGLVPSNPLALESGEIEAIADGVRAAWGLGDGPISNVVWLMERHGIIVARMSLDAPKLDGLSCWLDGRPYVVLNADVSAARSRFDAAHELAHVLLHRHLEQRIVNDPTMFAAIERQAHRFAAAFSFPAAAFAREAQPITLDRFIGLKERWRLSAKMMLHRAHDLHLVDDVRRVSLHRTYSARKWNSGEPLDAVQQPDRPRLLSKTIETLLDGGTQSEDELLYGAPFNAQNLARLSGLSKARFSGNVATVHEFQPQLRLLQDLPPSAGVVVPFPTRVHRD